MSDQDNLRDRIARAMFDADLCSGDASRTDWSWAQRLYGQSAQAVIDDLGLTVEERIDEPGKRGINPVGRIVGKWEKG